MRLQRIELTNFCHHKSLVVDFPIGITGIVGPNGSGKSTIVRALQFALLGESGNQGTKSDDLNWHAAADGESGSVDLTFEQNGTEGKLRRAIQVARASLKFGSINVRSVSDVNSEILKLLGAPKHVIEDVVLVMQGQLERILFDRPAERKKSIHALFGIDRTEPIRELLRSEIGSLSLSPLDDRIVQLKGRIETEIDPQLREISDARAGLSIELADKDEAGLKELVTKYEAASTLKEYIAKMETELHRLSSQPPIDLEALRLAVLAKKADVEFCTGIVDDARIKLANMNSVKQVSQTRKALISELSTLTQILSTPAPVQPDVRIELVKSGEEQIAEARADIAGKKAFISAFEGKGDAICPTCHQPVQNAGAIAENMKTEVVARQQQIDTTSALIERAREALSAFSADLARHTYEISQAVSRKQVVESTLSSMPSTDEYDEQVVRKLNEEVEKFSRMTAELSALDVKYNEASNKKTALDAQISGLKSNIDEARRQLSYQVSSEQYQSANAALALIISTREKLAELEGQFKQLQAQRASSIKELQSLEEQAKQMEGLKKYQSLCERTRTVFHYDNLPRLAMQQYLGVLNRKLNQFLSMFNVPFTSVIKNDLSVVCNTSDIAEKPAERLSGGQKVMLGVSFRTAIYNMFAADLGFMALDEPTAMLDSDRVSCVVDMLETVGRYIRNSNMQLIVITHREELKRAFDQTVTL